MRQHTWGRRLLVALLVVGLSYQMGQPPAHPAQARAVQAWSLPRPGPGLAARLRPALTRTTLVASSPFTWTQQAELTSTAQTPNDAFGLAVALGGNTAVVGAPTTPYLTAYGAAYVFARSGSTWTQQADLSDPGGVQLDQFGYAVAASADTVVIGAPGTTAAAAASGAAYVYGRSGDTWTLQATLTARDGAYNDELGNSVAISGSTILVGAWGKDGGAGAVYLFVRVGGSGNSKPSSAAPPTCPTRSWATPWR